MIKISSGFLKISKKSDNHYQVDWQPTEFSVSELQITIRGSAISTAVLGPKLKDDIRMEVINWCKLHANALNTLIGD